MTDRIILYGLITIVASLTLAFLKKATGKKITAQPDKKLKLKINILYGIIGILSLIFCLGLVVFFISINDDSTIIGLLIMFAIFGFPGIVSTLYYFNHYLVFDDKSMTAKNIYRQINTIEWGEISTMKFNGITGLITVKTKNKTNNLSKVLQNIIHPLIVQNHSGFGTLYVV